MADVEWPVADLPFEPFVQGYQEANEANKIRTPMASGPPKMRPRGTAGVSPIDVVLPLTRAQVATFRAFYRDTLGFGSLSFSVTHPRSLLSVDFQFRGGDQQADFEIVPEPGAAWWRATLHLEVLP